jgi:hypothetical protein
MPYKKRLSYIYNKRRRSIHLFKRSIGFASLIDLTSLYFAIAQTASSMSTKGSEADFPYFPLLTSVRTIISISVGAKAPTDTKVFSFQG